uniref:C2H2-type domain-containing protein n=1 Tax=Amphilophus citrinellus TaxID=61819 RepID=A0A3Q0SJ90_AMPCI
MITSHSFCRFVGCTSMMISSHSTTFQRCSIGLGCGDCGGTYLIFDVFCFLPLQLVEEYASRWQVPLPQLRILEIALCYFARASSSFASNCDHVLRTLSNAGFCFLCQECYLALATHQNVHLLQVECLVQSGGPWANPALQAILSESSLPQNEVDGYISSELPVFFELRVRYLLSYERINEAAALAKCCSRHPDTGQHLFFLQVYLTWLYKTSQHDCLREEVTDLNGKNAVHIICNLEFEEKDELLLALSTAFLTQQLWRGDMYCLCDLVFLWTKLHTRLNTSKQALLEETRQLMLSATNVNSIFPFIRAILQEVGEDGIQFCVELCANALKSCLPCDVLTKSLIYKTIAGLLHNDLEVCRACALLVFFLERTVESYKMVYLLYMHPDQEYHAENSSIGNNVRFEMLQVLKKDLYFDPEFWNLIALRTNCLKLMNEKGVSALCGKPAAETKAGIASRTTEAGKDRGSRVIDASVVDGTAQTQDDSLDTCENSEFMETPLESEESKLEYCCTFCKKDFIGPRVVEHAMFHYRKDECMFCGTVFTDDLLAMMHLSDHIEKLKRIKAQEYGVPDTKDVSMPKTKANTSSGCQSKGRPRKSAACPKSVSPPLECRKLRSTNRSADGSSSQEKQNMSKHLISKTPVHKVNGHIDEKKKFNRLKSYVEEKSLLVQDVDIGSSSTSVQADKKLGLKKKVSCPADGCSFFTDLSKNRVALLYHALDDHHGELKPLELAFHVGNNKCSICMRVLWSFEHFRHHVERHRQSPRHPCLHQGCTARFKTGMEMRRHARKHSPLQAVCCLPGCSQLFICLWALNLHEREHYGFKSTKPEKDTNAQGGDKHSDLLVGKKQQTASLNVPPTTEKAQKLKTEEKSKKSLVKKEDKNSRTASSDSSKAKKHEIANGKVGKKTVKKNCPNRNGAIPSASTQPAKSKSDGPQVEAKASTNSGPGYSVITNGQASGKGEDVKSSVFKETLAEYSKKPYMRLPPTAYLDEKYITMPKRRKDVSPVLPYQMSSPFMQVCLMSAVQRQRCANCFATFNSVEELQSHRQLQKCSDLFGFDSDDEGE